VAIKMMKESGTSVGRNVLGNVDTESDATIAGFALQQHQEKLLAFLMHREGAVRLASLQLLGTLLRQVVRTRYRYRQYGVTLIIISTNRNPECRLLRHFLECDFIMRFFYHKTRLE
jgi:hypothetical protein